MFVVLLSVSVTTSLLVGRAISRLDATPAIVPVRLERVVVGEFRCGHRGRPGRARVRHTPRGRPSACHARTSRVTALHGAPSHYRPRSARK